MISRWLHINTSVGDPWILPIWTAVNRAEQSGKVPRISKEVKSLLGLSISIRMDMLSRIFARINSEVNKVYSAAKAHKQEHIFTNKKEGYVIDIDNNLKFDLLTDIDSLFFELNSVCELITNLFSVLYKNIGKPVQNNKAGLKIKQIIEAAGKPFDWFQKLVSHRNFFIHEGTPYFAVDISQGPGKYDLLIMKKNIKCFKDDSKFIKLSEINSIVVGFSVAKPIIQKHLIELYE
jgi:hypothetical protein